MPSARTAVMPAEAGSVLSLTASCCRAGEAFWFSAIVCARLSCSVCWPMAVPFRERNGASRFNTLALAGVVLAVCA
ncbi:hypothetical protein [Methylobacterium pseudosasicola]|uniref:hypothetical protein n=1 Tax=Methylobacterium pseudosasicola TaxID=582667 RepID=UPI001FCDEA9E|nr:hypothetical protein [Methylobacterium pseudosasicola]